MAATHELWVQHPAELTTTIDRFVVQGYIVAAREATSVTLVKRKSFSVVWAVVGFFLCLLPLLVYLVVYATQTDQIVFVRLAMTGPQLSPDRQYWWNGTTWVDATALPPPDAPRSADGSQWWDGVQWRPARPAISG